MTETVRDVRPRRDTLAILLIVVLAAAIGSAFYGIKRDDWAEPDLRSMRAYRLSLMTDEQIRTVHAQATADASRYKVMDQDMRDKAFEEIAASHLVLKHWQRPDMMNSALFV